MSFNQEQIEAKIQDMYNHIDSKSQFYGRLINWHSKGVCHYGIGLSDDYLFDLGENLSVFHKNHRQITVSGSKQFAPDVTIQRLAHALRCFREWNYGLLGWNCEHYSRLVATNKAVSYQIKKSPLAFLNHGGYHPNAVQLFTQYLNQLGLNELTSLDKNEKFVVSKETERDIKMNEVFYPITGLLETIICEIYVEVQHQYEQRLKEIQIICDPHIRDAYAQQLLLDKFLTPLENAQNQIQKAAKHAHYMAEVVNYYYQDHRASKEEAIEISRQFQVLAIKLVQINSLYDFKLIYQIVTLFSHQLSRFKHREQKYSWEREIRKGILEPLNSCMAVEKNFQRGKL